MKAKWVQLRVLSESIAQWLLDISINKHFLVTSGLSLAQFPRSFQSFSMCVSVSPA